MFQVNKIFITNKDQSKSSTSILLSYTRSQLFQQQMIKGAELNAFTKVKLKSPLGHGSNSYHLLNM